MSLIFIFIFFLQFIKGAEGLFFSSEQKDEKKPLCFFEYSEGKASSHHLPYNPPIRKPRKGMTPRKLSHADMLVKYRECDCFEQNEEGWKYFTYCLPYFSDLDKHHGAFLKLKSQWETIVV